MFHSTPSKQESPCRGRGCSRVRQIDPFRQRTARRRLGAAAGWVGACGECETSLQDGQTVPSVSAEAVVVARHCAAIDLGGVLNESTPSSSGFGQGGPDPLFFASTVNKLSRRFVFPRGWECV